ncbi:MAG TPA: hypothetical protein PLN93_03480 [Vicinamibacterales bacterium]|nr:hypothetical protein [Vicinamibacterales bacterium]HOG27783.1 hypothetical protein [Vicinamibacterales bacterium]HOQ59064.1 hypothetical protein [Vicinamibacterales bacterium]HPK70981.1 hypothetical protein [Vicinamibacterales bacterium]HPW21828.1 hypothetical protein [Vicinamibacterales bacterium]
MMDTQLRTAVLAAAAILTSALASGPTITALASQDSAAAGGQSDLAVTVYNSSLALVRDVREFALPSGESDLRFVDIAATVNPATVHFRSLTDPARVAVLEQNYEYDLLEPEKLLRKYVGREVTLVRTGVENGTTKREEVKATLVSLNNGPIWKIGNEYVTGLGSDHLRFPELPSNLYSRPTLVWKLLNRGGPRHRIEASYLAGGLSWQSDYVLTVGRDDASAGLDGWVTLTNESGTAFRDATLQFVAGDLNRVQPAARKQMLEMMADARGAAPAMAQEAFAEYHLYTLGRRSTIENQQTKQLALLSGSGVPVEKRYVVDGQAFYYRNRQSPGRPLKDKVQVYYRFRNDAQSGLGAPMPAGILRVYQADAKGGLQFVGEDRIDHTPKDETIDVKIGSAFDVVCERNQTDFEKISELVYEMEYAVTLRNHKTTPVTVRVNEPIGGTWKMLRSSHAWEKTAAWAAQFTVPVAADGTAVLAYRVRVTY